MVGRDLLAEEAAFLADMVAAALGPIGCTAEASAAASPAATAVSAAFTGPASPATVVPSVPAAGGTAASASAEASVFAEVSVSASAVSASEEAEAGNFVVSVDPSEVGWPATVQEAVRAALYAPDPTDRDLGPHCPGYR